MKKALVLALIVLILFTGLPLALGMETMEPCPSCPSRDAPTAFAVCFAIVALVLATVVLRSTRAFAAVPILTPLLLATSLERPPRAS